MPRTPKPIELHKADGNASNKTKSELESRAANEIKFGDQKFKPSNMIKKKPKAYEKWKELIKLFAQLGTEYITTSDAGLIERYCLTHAEYLDLMNVYNAIMAKRGKGDGPDVKYKMIRDMRLDAAINKKLALLLKMDTQLILTPLAKLTKAGGGKPQAPDDPLAAAGFDKL